jgi:hypothetical protein
MAERLKENQIDETGVNPFNAPIPGESLTASPDTPKAWERPPQYTDEEDAMRAVYMVLTEQDSLRGLIEIISEGTPLDEIAQVVLYKGYVEGKYTPDLMLLLAEPTIYLLIAIADYAEIKDYVLYEGEDDDPDAMLPEDNITPVNIDEDDESDKPEEQAKPSKEGISDSLLARIEKDLPSKVEEVVNVKEEEVE